MRAKNYFVYRDTELNPHEYLVKSFYSSEINQMIYQVCRTIAFDDITGIEVDEIVVNGRQVRYKGWLPEMHMVFYYEDNPEEIAWDAYYPEWDH